MFIKNTLKSQEFIKMEEIIIKNADCVNVIKVKSEFCSLKAKKCCQYR